MPISLEPDKSFAVVLDGDKDKPADSRPTFYAKSQTMRGHESVLEVIDSKHLPDVTVADVFSRTCDKLSEVICDWSNMGSFVFGKAELKDLLTYQEAVELLQKVGRNSHVEPEEKKS